MNQSHEMTVGVLIRFANSASTLPDVLSALQSQSKCPHQILGVASQCSDDSRDLMISAGAKVLDWTGPYHHSRVLNFGISHLPTDLVLALSSHTVLESPAAIERLSACFIDRSVACASAKWDDDPYYSDSVSWNELQVKGLRFGSIYSNSMGMIRRKFWQTSPFDETLRTAEDYEWAINQVKLGRLCRRIATPFSYQRRGADREGEFARHVFAFGRRHHLPVAWLGATGAIRELLSRRGTPATRKRLLAWAESKLLSAI